MPFNHRKTSSLIEFLKFHRYSHVRAELTVKTHQRDYRRLTCLYMPDVSRTLQNPCKKLYFGILDEPEELQKSLLPVRWWKRWFISVMTSVWTSCCSWNVSVWFPALSVMSSTRVSSAVGPASLASSRQPIRLPPALCVLSPASCYLISSVCSSSLSLCLCRLIVSLHTGCFFVSFALLDNPSFITRLCIASTSCQHTILTVSVK